MTNHASKSQKTVLPGTGRWLWTAILLVAVAGAPIAFSQWWPKSADGVWISQGSDSNSSEMRRSAFEQDLERRVTGLLATVFGPGNVRVSMRAEMEFAARQTVTEKYDPDGQVARSSLNRQGGGIPASQDLPETGSSFEEQVEFEISKSTTTVIEDEGIVKKISAAVLINTEAGVITSDQLAVIKPLLRAAIGLDESRGDRLEIAHLPFSAIAGSEWTLPTQQSAQPSLSVLTIAGFGTASLLLIAGYLSARRRTSAATPPSTITSAKTVSPLIGGGDTPATVDSVSETPLSTSELRSRVAQLVDQNPDRALVVMRSWLHETTAQESGS